MIRAVYQDGSIRPIDPVPASWSEGQELEIEEAVNSESLADIDRWAAELEAQVSRLDDEDWSRFEAALEQADRISSQLSGREHPDSAGLVREVRDR